MESIFLLAVGTLLLNDHYLKTEYHNFITGKLSDTVGPFVLYRLLRGFDGTGGIGHWGATIIVLLFAIGIKSSQAFADQIVALTCTPAFDRCQLIADPGDIFAFVPFAILMISRKGAR